MNKHRLLKLADLLEADAKNKKGVKFDFNSWGCITDKDKPLSCSTSACAMGLAAVSGAFKRTGLDYYTGKLRWYDRELKFKWDGRSASGVWAAMKLFNLSRRDAEYLFTSSRNLSASLPTGAKSERAVAKRIRDFVAGKVVA